MSNRIYTGSLISELVALIESRVCRAPECDRLGRSCAGCSTYVCAAHGEECPDCGGLQCEECATFHPVYCKAFGGGPVGNGEDPVHDHRRDALRTQHSLSDQDFQGKEKSNRREQDAKGRILEST
jgi:hypothetical protein